MKVKKKRYCWAVCIFIFSLGCFSLGTYLLVFDNYRNDTAIKHIKILSYDLHKKIMHIEIEPKSKENYCAITKDHLQDSSSLSFAKMAQNKCVLQLPVDSYYGYFKNKYGSVSEQVVINNFVLDFDIKDTYYLAIGQKENLESNILQVGNAPIVWKIENPEILRFHQNQMTGLKKGTTKVQMIYNQQILKEFSVIVTNAITVMPKEFNLKKPYLGCKTYSEEDASLADLILEERIHSAGYKTRAGAVAAARFLTLEFPYRITYFFENGRVHPHDGNYADGEGRYYHKGLYLSESKFKDISGSFAGPAIWGCPLMNFESTRLFQYRKKYPNGLDCSGFVSWVLYNGGFDVKDIGAGESSWPYELTDLGDFQALTPDLIASGKIRVGDLINDWGHIAIIVGIDSNHFYVAESLDIYGGVVVRKYPKKTVTKTFTYVVLMDDVYLEDGNLTDMWY